MKWIQSPPPKWVHDKAVKMFGISMEAGVMFTYGDNIHSLYPPAPDVVVHEEVHQRQQATISPELWWETFFKSDSFRLAQEMEAYRAQYKFVKKNVKDRNKQAEYLDFFARSLCGPYYGKIISYGEAMKQIRNPSVTQN